MSSQQYNSKEAEREIEFEREIAQTMTDMTIFGLPTNVLYYIALGGAYHPCDSRFRSRSKDLKPAIKYWADLAAGQQAAAKLLAEMGEWNLYLLKAYARTGYQDRLERFNPLYASVSRSYRGGELDADDIFPPNIISYLFETPINGLRSLSPDFWSEVGSESDFVSEGGIVAERVADMIRSAVCEKTDKFLKLRQQVPLVQSRLMAEIML